MMRENIQNHSVGIKIMIFLQLFLKTRIVLPIIDNEVLHSNKQLTRLFFKNIAYEKNTRNWKRLSGCAH